MFLFTTITDTYEWPWIGRMSSCFRDPPLGARRHLFSPFRPRTGSAPDEVSRSDLWWAVVLLWALPIASFCPFTSVLDDVITAVSIFLRLLCNAAVLYTMFLESVPTTLMGWIEVATFRFLNPSLIFKILLGAYTWN